MAERTLLIVKPDATERHLIGHIVERLECARFTVLAMRLLTLTDQQAREFYAVHKERPFYSDLVEFMTSGPVVPVVLERDNAVAALRELVGATDPAKAACGTIRHDIGLDVQRNSVHASDGEQTAETEITFFFDNL
jgi:nucleoside-diphosphate kinase